MNNKDNKPEWEKRFDKKIGDFATPHYSMDCLTDKENKKHAKRCEAKNSIMVKRFISKEISKAKQQGRKEVISELKELINSDFSIYQIVELLKALVKKLNQKE